MENVITGEIEFCDDEKITYKITKENQEKIIQTLIDYFENYGYFGESIQQNDNAIIEAPNVLSHICDNLIEWEVENK